MNLNEQMTEFAAELRAKGTPTADAEALLIEQGITQFHWGLMRAAKDAGVAPSDFMLALQKQTYATCHAVCKMVEGSGKPGYTEKVQVVLLEAAIDNIAVLGQ